jgi:hypothetical protein
MNPFRALKSYLAKRCRIHDAFRQCEWCLRANDYDGAIRMIKFAEREGASKKAVDWYWSLVDRDSLPGAPRWVVAK